MQNPFEQKLRPARSGPLAGPALEAPLPLGDGAEQDTDDDALKLFDCNLGILQIIAACGPSRQQELMARPWISLLYVVRGEVEIVQSGRQFCSNAGGCILIPQPSVQWQSQAFDVVCLMLPPQRLAALTGAPIHGDGRVPGLPTALLTVHEYSRGRSLPEQLLLELLEANLRAVAAFLNHDPHLIERLALADQLSRTIAALVSLPAEEQAWPEQQLRHGAAGMQDTLDDLIAFIQANLDQPLNLTVLENHTHYSRRALQYAFRQRLGCTPSQWIRSQRLDAAYQQLQNADASDNVSRIAQRCGYHSVSLFSIDFQQRFHIKPSHLLRKGRQQG